MTLEEEKQELISEILKLQEELLNIYEVLNFNTEEELNLMSCLCLAKAYSSIMDLLP